MVPQCARAFRRASSARRVPVTGRPLQATRWRFQARNALGKAIIPTTVIADAENGRQSVSAALACRT